MFMNKFKYAVGLYIMEVLLSFFFFFLFCYKRGVSLIFKHKILWLRRSLFVSKCVNSYVKQRVWKNYPNQEQWSVWDVY